MNMAKTKFDIKTEATKPLFAYVGVTDLAVEVVRDFVSETQTRLAGVQKDVTARVADVQKTAADPKALRDQAATVVTARIEGLTKDAKARRKAIEARVIELQAEAKAYPAKVQTLVDDNVTTLATQATGTYAELVKRGESLVGRIRRQESTKATVKSARTTVSKAKTTTTQAKKAVDAEVTATKKTNTAAKTAAKKATAKKAPVRKAAAKKTATAQSSAKATVTAAEKTATNAVQAVADAAEKVGD
jgi:heparin binding hemagglutinin HbhA